MRTNNKILDLIKKITKKKISKKNKILEFFDSLELLKMISIFDKNKIKFNFHNLNKSTTLDEFIDQLNKDNKLN